MLLCPMLKTGGHKDAIDSALTRSLSWCVWFVVVVWFCSKYSVLSEKHSIFTVAFDETIQCGSALIHQSPDLSWLIESLGLYYNIAIIHNLQCHVCLVFVTYYVVTITHNLFNLMLTSVNIIYYLFMTCVGWSYPTLTSISSLYGTILQMLKVSVPSPLWSLPVPLFLITVIT